MTGALKHVEADRLRAAITAALAEGVQPGSPAARRAILEVIGVLESSPGAVSFASDSVLTTQEAADILGVSRMTVVRLVDRGELASAGAGVHRRISASELGRYVERSSQRRRRALDSLAQDIDEDLPPDEVIETR